jgi:hypothetical protein
VESVTKEACCKAIGCRKAAAQRGAEMCDGLPCNVVSIFNVGAEHVVSARGVEMVS